MLFLQNDPDPEQVHRRIVGIRESLEHARSDAEREDLQLRLARLAGGVATVWVGRLAGESAEETQERREVVARSRELLPGLITDGLVAGGGVVLRDAGRALEGVADGPAKSVLLSGLAAPGARILTNSGYPLGAILLDVLTGRTGSMFDLGVVDSALVVEGALTAAVATTRQFLALA
ncbi:hypothetical protein [Saccharothrix variisporea]|uniref:hypothetical protein n=1 Tax=Saccharothrix variisporea TaxID=543527 RepID=UPI001FE27483|nr:hypothetical protein [Saccharothrix variisporea]